MNENYDIYLNETFKDLVATPQAHLLYVSFNIDAKEWKKSDKGRLYGVDLGNLLYRLGVLKQYAIPSVNDKVRASKGIKTIFVTYNFRDQE